MMGTSTLDTEDTESDHALCHGCTVRTLADETSDSMRAFMPPRAARKSEPDMREASSVSAPHNDSSKIHNKGRR